MYLKYVFLYRNSILDIDLLFTPSTKRAMLPPEVEDVVVTKVTVYSCRARRDFRALLWTGDLERLPSQSGLCPNYWGAAVESAESKD